MSQNNSVRLCMRGSREGLFFADSSISHQAPYPELTLIGLKMYMISLSFDDGFEQSNQKIADIYEQFVDVVVLQCAGASSQNRKSESTACGQALTHYPERTH